MAIGPEGYGDAVLRRHDDELGVWIEVVEADDIIGVSLDLLADAGECTVDDDGWFLLAGNPEYRYRPVRFRPLFGHAGFPPALLILERVR